MVNKKMLVAGVAVLGIAAAAGAYYYYKIYLPSKTAVTAYGVQARAMPVMKMRSASSPCVSCPGTNTGVFSVPGGHTATPTYSSGSIGVSSEGGVY